MKVVLSILTVVLISTCQSTKKNTKEVVEISIDEAVQLNIEKETLVTGWYYLESEANNFERELVKSEETYFLNPKPIATQSDFEFVEVYTTDFPDASQNYTGLLIRLDEDGAERWRVATANSVGGQLAIVIEDELIQVAKVNSEIQGGNTAINRGDFTKDEVDEYFELLSK